MGRMPTVKTKQWSSLEARRQDLRMTIPYLPYFLYSFSEHVLFSAGLDGLLIWTRRECCLNDVWEVHHLCWVCCLDQDLIWSAGSQGCGILIDHRDIIAAAFPGRAVTCYEVGLPAFIILAPRSTASEMGVGLCNTQACATIGTLSV